MKWLGDFGRCLWALAVGLWAVLTIDEGDEHDG